MGKRLTTKEFIQRAILIHQNKYDYNLVNYINGKTKVEIICKEHGIFEQIAESHLLGIGCPRCAGVQRLTTEEFIQRAKLIHQNKYDYSLTNYINNKTKVKIICKEHGVFEQIANNHLNRNGCPICGGKEKSNTEEFIRKAKLVHRDKYDYNLVNYKNSKIKVKIICKEHSVFEQRPNDHLSSYGCPICSSSKGELQIDKYLVENNIKFEREKKFKELGKFRFDFYIPRTNTVIEFDGIQHFKAIKVFGGEKELRRTIKSDRLKNQYCEDNNINLIRIS